MLFIWSLVMIITIISGGIFLSLSFSEQHKSSAIHQAQEVTANAILIHAQAHLVSEDFAVGDYEKKEMIFSKFFKSIDTTEVIRIKVWSKEGIILFSDSKEIVGENFSDNPNFQKAIMGSVMSIIKEPEKPENIAEKGYGQLMEVYVPVIIEDKIVGVIETYTSLDHINKSINDVNQIILIVTLTVILFVISIILVSGYNLERSIVMPIKKLQESTKEISRGNFDVNLKLESSNEINELAKDVNKMANELAKNQKDLIKVERLKSIGELSSRLAHDLRNPLSSIRLSTKIIEQNMAKSGCTKHQKNLDAINRSIGRMTYQMDSVLDFIRTKPLCLEEVSINEIIKKALETIKVPENVTIDLERNDAKITCDIERMSIVFTNLITNAIQAINKNSGKVTIRIKNNDNQVSCEIIDSGPSIPEDELEKIFEPLFTTKQTGTGLGLASCYSIMEQHNGTISVHNNPTTFTITIPKIITIQNQKFTS